MFQLIVGYNNENVVNCNNNYDVVHTNGEPTVVTVSKYPDD